MNKGKVTVAVKLGVAGVFGMVFYFSILNNSCDSIKNLVFSRENATVSFIDVHISKKMMPEYCHIFMPRASA